MMGKMEVKTSPAGRPRDGRHCDLCGCSQPAVRCDKCGCQIFCLSCDDMYHRHPKRRFHLRKAVDPIPTVPQARPVLPVKVAHLNATNPGDPSKMPLPPPRKKKSIFGGFRRASPSSDQSSPTLPKKEYSWTDRLGSIKKFMSNRPLPPLPTGEENDGDLQTTTNGQSPTRGDLSFIHRRSDERPPQLPQRSPKSPDFPSQNLEREDRFPNATMQMPGQVRNGITEPNENHMNQNHEFPTNNDNQWNNRFPNQNGPHAFGTLQRQNHKGFMPPGAPGYPGGMHQSSSATDLHNLQNMEGMPSGGPPPPHYPHYPVNPHMPPHYPYPMYPQFPNYPQYFGHSFANLSNPPTTDGDVSDQSEGASSRHSSKKHPFRKRAKRSQSVMMDRMAYPGQFPYPGPYGPYPGYGPWGAPMPMETPPSPASSLRSLSRSGRTRRRKKMTSEEDDEEFSVSSSPLSRPKSSSSGQKDSPQRAPLARHSSSSEEESDDEMRNRRNKINTIQRRQSEPNRTSSSPAEEPTKKSSKLKKSSSKQSDSEPQEVPQVRNERRPSIDSIPDQPAPQHSSSPASAPSPTWECRHCTYVNPIGNRICQVCCKTATPMTESPVTASSRPPSSAAASPKPSFDSGKGYSTPDKSQEAEDIRGKKEKRDMEILNTALDEAEKEISRGLEELMKLKDDIDTSMNKDTKSESEETSKPVYKSSGRMRTSILDKLSLNKPQTSKSTASTSTETQTGQGNCTNERILEGRRPSNASSASDTYNSPIAQSPELERRFPTNMQKRDSSCQTQQDSSCQTQQDNLAEYLESKRAAEEAYLGRPINNFGFGYGDRMDMMQSPVPSMYDRFFGGGMGGMIRSHSRASLFSGRVNDPMDFGGPGFGYGPAPMYRSISRGSLTGDYTDGRLSEFHNLRKPDFYLSMEELVERRRQENMRAQGLELVRMIREAEQQGFTADDIQVALTHCGKQSPMEWLQDNWRNMLDSVVTLSTNYGNDKKENDIGVLSENEAREALRLHKGNIWAAVTECVEGRQRKYLELSARGKFSRKDIVDALTSSEGDVEMAYAKLTKSTGKPFLMRIWGDGEGAQNQDGAQPMPENLTDMNRRFQKDDVANSDFLSDEIWSGDEDVEWEEEEYEEERGEFEDLHTCREDLTLGAEEMRTPESDKSDYIDAFALEDRNLSSPSDDIFFVIPEQKPEKKKGFLGKLAALRRDSKEQVGALSNVGKDDISLKQSSDFKKDTLSQSSASSAEQPKGNGALSALKNTLNVIKDTVTGTSKTDKKLPCAQPEKRTIIVKGQLEHESLNTDSKNAVQLTSVKPLEEDLSLQKSEKEPLEKLKGENKPSNAKIETTKITKGPENKLSPDKQSLETRKEPEKLTNFKKEVSSDEKMEDTKIMGDNQINTNTESVVNKNLHEIPVANQTETQSKVEKKKPQSLAEKLKFAKQAQTTKTTSNSNSIQNDNSIPSTSGLTVSINNKQVSNVEMLKKLGEREKSELVLQNQISKDAGTATGYKVNEITPENSGISSENKQTDNQQNLVKEKPPKMEIPEVTGTSTAKDISLTPQNEFNITVVNQTESPSKDSKTPDNSTKANSKTQVKQAETISANKTEKVINKDKIISSQNENLPSHLEVFKKKKPKETDSKSQVKQAENPSANKIEDVINKDKVISNQNENLPVHPETFQQKKLKETDSNTTKEQKTTEISQDKETIKQATLAENNVPESVLSDTKISSEKIFATKDIPKLSKKPVENVEHLIESSSSQVKQNTPSINDTMSNEIACDGAKQGKVSKTEKVKNQEMLLETTLQAEQKTSADKTETSNNVNGKNTEELVNVQSFQIKSENSQDVYPIEESVEQTIKDNRISSPQEMIPKNVESIAEVSAKVAMLDATLNNVENADNTLPEETFHDALDTLENKSNVLAQKTLPQGMVEHVENVNYASVDKTVQDKEISSNGMKFEETQHVNQILDNITKSEAATSIAETKIPDKTQQETNSLTQSETQKHTDDVAEMNKFESSLGETSKENSMNLQTLLIHKPVEPETEREKLQISEPEISFQVLITENPAPEKLPDTQQLVVESYSMPTTDKDLNEISVTNEDNKTTYMQAEVKQELNNAEQLKASVEKHLTSSDHKNEVSESQNTSSNTPKAEKNTELLSTTSASNSMTINSTSKDEINEIALAATTEQSTYLLNSETTQQKIETGENLTSNSEANLQIDKENSEIAKINSEIHSSDIKRFEEDNGEQIASTSKESSDITNGNMKDSNQIPSSIGEVSEQKTDVDSKANQILEIPTEVSQITESKNDNKSTSAASTSKEKVVFPRTPREVKSGKLISEKIERLRRSFSREENDIKSFLKERSNSKSEIVANLSGISSNTSKKDVKDNFGVSSSATEVPVSQTSQKESAEVNKNSNDKAVTEQQIKNHVETENANSVSTVERKSEVNESERLRGEKDLLPSDNKTEISESQSASTAPSESKQITELSNSESTSDGNASTSKDSLHIPEASIASTSEQFPASSKETTRNPTTDENLQQTSQNDNNQEIMDPNHITSSKTNIIDIASSSANATDGPSTSETDLKTVSSSEAEQVSTSAITEIKEVVEVQTSSTVPEQSEHSSVQDNVTDIPPSSAGSIEQTLQNISQKLSESKNSTSESKTSTNTYDTDDTDIDYSDDESRPSSITPPNPIDMLRSRFEGLAGGTSARGTVRPQSPFRRMSLNSRKQVIALEKIRETKGDKLRYQQKSEPFQTLPRQKRTIKQQLEMERNVRKLVADRVVATYRKAEIVVQLLELNFEQEEAIQAATECSTLEQAISYLQQECQLCAGYFPVSQIVSMTHCQHRACLDCIRAYFTVQIRDRTILDLLCPFCNQPDIGDEDVAQDYFNHLDIMLKKLVDVEIHELFQRKLRDRVLMKDPNFRWCSQCSSGFIAMPNLTRLVCPDCNAVTCASCRRVWEKDHQGISCEAFAALKDSSDPEAQAAGLAKMLTEDGIACPSCHFRYALAKGGCMHFRCIQCQHDFCSGCSRPFKMGQKCGVSEFCTKLGLHAHHPRNCLFYLRDKEPEDLQKLLDMNDVKYNKDPPEGMEIKDICQVLEQKETADGMVDDYCGKEIQDGYAGLCRVHYVEYLGQLVNKHQVDPIQIFDNDDLELVLRRANIRLPPKRYRENDWQYREKLVNVIQEELPLDKMDGS